MNFPPISPNQYKHMRNTLSNSSYDEWEAVKMSISMDEIKAGQISDGYHTFDCKSCWKEAIIEAEGRERTERLREAQDKYAVDAYYYAYRKKFVDRVSEFIGYLEIDELKIRPDIFVKDWNCEECKNRWINDDDHDTDLCLECFGEAMQKAYDEERR